MPPRHFEDLKDKRLVNRGNSILDRLFANSVHSIRQLARIDSEAKAMYRFFQNDRVSEQDIIKNMVSNCRSCVGGKSVLCIQDSSEINLFKHRNRLKKDDSIGVTQASVGDLGFFIHPSLVMDSQNLMPYGFSHVKVWNRTHKPDKKPKGHKYNKVPIEEKEPDDPGNKKSDVRKDIEKSYTGSSSTYSLYFSLNKEQYKKVIDKIQEKDSWSYSLVPIGLEM